MGAFTGQGRTYDLPNYVGELISITPADTPLLSMIGGLNGGRATTSTYFTWQTVDNAAASQPAIVEGADTTFTGRTRSEVVNVVQIFQEGFELSYTKQAATGQLAGEKLLGNQPVMDEDAFQMQLKMEKVARDVEFTFLRGVYQRPVDNTTARKTRGIEAAITTNSVAAAGARLSKTHIDTLLRTMADAGAPLRNPVIFAGAFNRQMVSEIYGYAPEDRNVGGVAISQVLTDFASMGIVYDRHMLSTVVDVIEVSELNPVFLEIPGKGHFFAEPLAKSGAYDRWQLYGEIGLEYGYEGHHGEITGLASS